MRRVLLLFLAVLFLLGIPLSTPRADAGTPNLHAALDSHSVPNSRFTVHADVANEQGQRSKTGWQRRYRERTLGSLADKTLTKQPAQGPTTTQRIQPASKALSVYDAPIRVTTPPELLATNSIAGHSVDDLLAAGEAADRNGLTAAGRALQKHGAREGSVFPEVAGGPKALNPAGRDALEGILNDPGKTVVSRSHPSLGEVVDIRTPGGQGARFTKDGKFIGFLDPGRKP